MSSIVIYGERMNDIEQQSKIQLKKTGWSKKKKIMAAVLMAMIVVGVSIAGVLWYELKGSKVCLFFSEETMTIGKEVTVDVKVTDLPEMYPAASFVIDFDPNQLEFKEIKQGNIKIVCVDGSSFIPEWNYQPEIANANGQVSTMYLDMTAGDKPFSRKGFKKDDRDVLFRLTFDVKYSCSEGETIQLKMNQATFATVQGEGYKTLSLHDKNLRAKSKEYKVRQE